MLTGVCDACHETMSFGDYLAGMNMRCKRCGQGWVRVPQTSGVTTSASDFAERGPTTPSDTATTDQRPMPARAPYMEERPAGTCPRCGSASFTRLKMKQGTGLTNDRECKECGTPYPTIAAPMSSTVQTAMYVSGVVFLLGGVLMGLVWLAAMQGAMRGGSPSVSPLGVFFSLLMGANLLRMPQQMQQRREKRLKEYQVLASVSPGATPPVEIPRPPDAVFLSTLFGTLSLLSPLISSLLMVVLFGPAAVVCGIVALAQGHLKGLIGLLLGVVSTIVWGLVFVYFFQG